MGALPCNKVKENIISTQITLENEKAASTCKSSSTHKNSTIISKSNYRASTKSTFFPSETMLSRFGTKHNFQERTNSKIKIQRKEEPKENNFKIAVYGTERCGKKFFLSNISKNVKHSFYSIQETDDLFIHKVFLKNKNYCFDFLLPKIEDEKMLDADSYFILFDLTSTSSFFNIMQLIKNKFREVPEKVYLIGNKCDLIEQRVVSSEKIQRYIQKFDLKYYEISSLKELGIKKLLRESFTNSIKEKKEIETVIQM